ncbi:helicase-related protein [Methanobacterium formicicum]|nr:helicase-related protein [Methanobacterium formicicum]MDH2658959.1 helicase-related protein [Methanobacterium formicicum]
MKAPKMLDNKKNGTVHEELRENLQKGSKLSIISAYFTIYAYYELRNELNKIDDMRFIFTKPSFLKNDNEQYREYYIDKNFERDLFVNEFEIKLRNEMKQSHIARECAQWLEDKAQIKSFKNINSAQPRMVYIENPEENVLINGSVDFTTDGLGITPSNRSDFNSCMYGKEATFHYLQNFNELWDDKSLVDDVKQKVLEQMQVMYKENPGEFIYFVTMYNIFRDYLDELTEENIVKTRTGFKETQIWNKLYKFQKDAVIGAIDKMEKHNGCILADSVGLGKTFTALAVIKYYELRNDRVLVLVPKKLRENWTIYTKNDLRNLFLEDRFNYDVLNHTDLSRYDGISGEINLKTINWSNYDLIVIDESHNFRNNPSFKDRITRYERLMNDIIKSGVKTKVLMLSATPVNNRMNDIKNQISFITEDRDNAFEDIGLDSVQKVLSNAQMVFNAWSKLEDEERTGEKFVDMMNLDYFKLLDTLTIARSRKHIEKYYNLDEVGRFPIRKNPINQYSDIDTEHEFPPLKEVNSSIKRLKLAIYSPLEYLLPDKREAYSEKYDMLVGEGHAVFKQTDRERQVVELMRINMLKRMESSIHSFKLTIATLLDKISYLVEKIETNDINFDPTVDISLIDPDEEEYDDMMFGKKKKVLFKDMDLIKWKQDLVADKEKLTYILREASQITPGRDAKLQDLKKIIHHKLHHPINDNNKKIVIFTAFADTAKYLYENLSEWALNDYNLYTALVTGSDENKTTLKGIGATDINNILTNFSPISKERAKINSKLKDEIDILIGTDCISEGQNLQDCDYLINYDIHWNPVRIIQRFGRIDRIGSINDEIQLVNFWPNMELDEYIKLKGRVENRMVMVDVSATGEENIIEDGNKKKMNDLEYRKKQLTRLQEEVIDLEDVSGGISITDLTFNDFKIDLMEYMKENRQELEEAPTGIYSIVEIDDSLKESVKPGVIFTLRQVKGFGKTKDQNPLYPFFLTYITNDGEVKLSYLHVKKILDYYKKLCLGEKEVLLELVNEFNQETNDGQDMQLYSDLLADCIDNILGKKEEIGVNSLFHRGGTSPVKNTRTGLEEFELVTFLILR